MKFDPKMTLKYPQNNQETDDKLLEFINNKKNWPYEDNLVKFKDKEWDICFHKCEINLEELKKTATKIKEELPT